MIAIVIKKKTGGCFVAASYLIQYVAMAFSW